MTCAAPRILATTLRTEVDVEALQSLGVGFAVCEKGTKAAASTYPFWCSAIRPKFGSESEQNPTTMLRHSRPTTPSS